MSDPLPVYVSKWTTTYQIDLLSIQTAHVLALVGLPDHHKDPFDRILIAQGSVEGMTIVTADSKFNQYSVPLLW